MTRSAVKEYERVLYTPDTDVAHRPHPELKLSSACHPVRRGFLGFWRQCSGDRCQHQACFGGTDA